MAIKITISDRVTFKVAGAYTDEAGAAQAFDFHLTATRLSQDALKARTAEGTPGSILDFLLEVVQDWRGVLDGDGKPVPYSGDALRALCNNVPGAALLAFNAYFEHVGARAKN